MVLKGQVSEIFTYYYDKKLDFHLSLVPFSKQKSSNARTRFILFILRTVTLSDITVTEGT